MKKKQLIRQQFRDSVYKRDKYCCVICGKQANIENAQEILDAHHIINRDNFKDGGYTLDNGISLCKGGTESCHYKAEIGIYSIEYLRSLI